MLVVAAMQPAHQIELLSQRRLAGSALSAKGRSIGAELAGWGGGAGAAVVLLSWAAFAKLVASESGGIGESSVGRSVAPCSLLPRSAALPSRSQPLLQVPF